ncbi:MAG: nucleotide exchange factor GrpE [Clostridia bacterium]|nr:nucleotide exchange factor GrpE [Clostridia bacterium]
MEEKVMEDKKNETLEDMTEEAAEETAENTAESAAENSTAAETAEDTAAEDGKLSRQDKKKLKKLEGECAELSKKLSETEAKLADANDKYTRLFAEYDNYRKRSAKEREGIYTDAYIEAVTEILPILDNMERALQYKDGEGENIAKGLEMIMKSFSETLEKMGVSEIEALGKTFDPNLHNAVMHVEDEAYGENEIVEVFMKGYSKGDKVLRHSMVKVAN